MVTCELRRHVSNNCIRNLFSGNALAMSVNHRSKFTTTNTSKARCEATVMSNVCCIHVTYNIVIWYVWQCMHAIRSKGLGKHAGQCIISLVETLYDATGILLATATGRKLKCKS